MIRRKSKRNKLATVSVRRVVSQFVDVAIALLNYLSHPAN